MIFSSGSYLDLISFSLQNYLIILGHLFPEFEAMFQIFITCYLFTIHLQNEREISQGKYKHWEIIVKIGIVFFSCVGLRLYFDVLGHFCYKTGWLVKDLSFQNNTMFGLAQRSVSRLQQNMLSLYHSLAYISKRRTLV